MTKKKLHGALSLALVLLCAFFWLIDGTRVLASSDQEIDSTADVEAQSETGTQAKAESEEQTDAEAQSETTTQTSKKTKTRFIAHRGLRSEAPENTARAFILAGEAGFWGCETDVYRTTDGQFVCSHDDSLLRMAGIEANITDITYQDLKDLYLMTGSNYENYRDDLLAITIPTLEDYLMICKIYQMVPVIEIKELDERETSEIDLEYSRDLYEYVDEIMEGKPLIYISHNIDQLKAMKEFATEDNRSRYYYMLLTTEITEEIQTVCQENAFFIDSRYSGADEEQVTSLEEEGFHVGIWTVNYKSQVKAFYNAGATFITTDRVFWENNKME